MLALPLASAVAIPDAFTVATLLALDDQVTCDVKLLLLPSLYVPVAVNCWVPLTGIEALAGATAMEASVVIAGGVVEAAPPQPVSIVAVRNRKIPSKILNCFAKWFADVLFTDPPEHARVWPLNRPVFRPFASIAGRYGCV
jgi:hypothetical protein